MLRKPYATHLSRGHGARRDRHYDVLRPAPSGACPRADRPAHRPSRRDRSTRSAFRAPGTQYGLNRYDGYRFRVSKNDPTDPDSLCDVHITALFKDRAGRLWVGCAYSVDRYDPGTEKFVHYRLERSATAHTSGDVRHISQDREGRLWLSTGNGLYSLDPESGSVQRFAHEISNSIAREALRNAAQHSQGHRFEAELHYGEKTFILRIRDDGVGIDAKVVRGAQRASHWGLQGMRERAESFGARLDVWSELGAGTEIELSIPAPIAYDRAGTHRSWFEIIAPWKRS